jgi:hypothetical protein
MCEVLGLCHRMYEGRRAKAICHPSPQHRSWSVSLFRLLTHPLFTLVPTDRAVTILTRHGVVRNGFSGLDSQVFTAAASTLKLLRLHHGQWVCTSAIARSRPVSFMALVTVNGVMFVVLPLLQQT